MERYGSTTRTLRIAPTTGGSRDDSPEPLASDLAREFDAPAGLLDPLARAWRSRAGAPDGAFPDADDAAVASAGPADQGRAIVWRPEPGSGPSWLGLPVPRPEGACLVAWLGFAPDSPADRGLWGAPCPEPALRAWGQAVAERLRVEAGGRIPPAIGGGMAREHPLPERLVRRLRVNDPPERFQRLATQALRDVLAVEAVAWVPGTSREPVVVAGAVVGLEPEAFRGLVQASAAEAVRIVNRVSVTRGAAVRRLAVVAADPESPAGWLVAVNPADDRPFASAEVEVLQPVASLIGTQRSNARLYADLKDLLFGVIRALTSAIDAKDPYTSGHSERVARIAVRLGEALGMPPHGRGDLYLMGLLHDVGKIGIDDGVLKKRGSLTPEEYRLIQSHVRIGVHILSDLKKLHHLLPGVAYHHESLDGTGYPSGLSGDAIPLPARILAVADAFDAMSSTRPYRRRLPSRDIDEIFRKGSGVQWDSQVVDALFACRADIERIRSKGLGESLQQAVGDALGRT